MPDPIDPGALPGISSDELLARLEASGLRGRGGGWFPAARKWRAVRTEGGTPLVVANGAEGEPGSIKDRHLMRSRPAEVLSGLALAARGVGAREAVVFLKASFAREAEALHRALAAGAAASLSVRVAHGDDSYIVGEETALLESLEGRRPWPRPKPPLPAAVGFEGRPTLIHNVETLLRLNAALADPASFRATEATFVSLWGDVGRCGLHEVPLGTPLRRMVEKGDAPDGVSFVLPGGPSSPALALGQLDTPLDPDALRATGSGLGTASLLVVGRSRDPFDLAVSVAAFFERESCGQCPPCVRGTESLHRVMRALRAREARARDVTDIDEVAGFMAMHGYCAHCRAGAGAVTRLVAHNRAAIEALLATPRSVPAVAGESSPRGEGRGPVGFEPRGYDPFAPGSPQRRAIEALLS
jgi:NADH:ubiquinone oxidoreductase subunit F (NADH-binding)